MAGFARGMEGTRTLRPPGEPRRPRRRREGTPHPRRRQVAAYRLLLAGGRVLPWSPTAWRGSRDRETRGPRVEAGTVGPRAWSPCCGRRTSGSLQRLLAGAQAAGNSSRTNAADAGRLRSRGPSGRSAPGSGRSPEAASRRRAAVGLPRGPGPTSRLASASTRLPFPASHQLFAPSRLPLPAHILHPWLPFFPPLFL